MQPIRKQHSLNKINLAVDLTTFVAFLVIMVPHSSGTPVHEWLSLAFAVTLIVHLLLNWQWIVSITRRFMGKVQGYTRLNYIVNLLLFIMMTVAIFTGLMISQHVLPLFGIQTVQSGVWRQVHSVSASLALGLVGIHLGLNWQWVVNATKRYLLASLQPHHAAARSREAQPTLPEV